MRTRCGLAIALFLTRGLAAPALAHRLDEYLQATTVSVGHGSVMLQLRLTPGVDVAPALIASLDANHDGAFSEPEAKTYADRVVSDLSLTIDGREAPLHLDGWSFSPFPEMARGQAESTLTLSAAYPSGRATHDVMLENRHEGGVAAYLVNALQPESPDVQILAQRRNYDQSRYELSFAEGPRAADAASTPGASDTYGHWVFLGALVVAAIALWRFAPVRW